MGTDVKYMHSSMTGAPTLSGQAGTLIALLDACLVNGFGLGTLDSLVIAGGVATATRAAGHPFEVDSVALVAGATVTGGTVNGERKVLSVTGTTYTFDATGLADQTATGTITHKVAPAGWAKEFNATNLAVYKSSDVAATACRLRVDDTGTNNARVVGYQTMTDVNTGIGPFPTAAQVSGGAYWGKSASADATTRPWIIVADARGFYLAVSWNSGSAYQTAFFGDIASNKSTDAYGCVLQASNSSITSSTPGVTSGSELSYSNPAAEQQGWLARNALGVGGSKTFIKSAAALTLGTFGIFSGSNSGSPTMIQYPNPADNGLYLTPLMICELTPNTFRGVFPGYRYAAQNLGATTFTTRDKVAGVSGMAGRSLIAVGNNVGFAFIDITGPWR